MATWLLIPALTTDDGVAVVKELNEIGRRAVLNHSPTNFVDGKWDLRVLKEDSIDRHAYELCVLSELRSGLRSGDIWINRSRQHKVLEEYLLSDAEWQRHKEEGTTEIKGEADWKIYLEERRETFNQHLKTVEKLLAEGGVRLRCNRGWEEPSYRQGYALVTLAQEGSGCIGRTMISCIVERWSVRTRSGRRIMVSCPSW